MKELIKNFFNALTDAINLDYAKIAAVATAIASPILYYLQKFYSPVSDMFVPIIIIVGIDMVFGIVASVFVEKQSFTSDRFWLRKALVTGVFMVVLTAMLAFDLLLKNGLHDAMPPFLTRLWIYFYISYEVVSILENVGRLKFDGKPLIPFIPSFITKVKTKLGIITEEEKKDDVH